MISFKSPKNIKTYVKMNKRTLIAGIVVLAIGITLGLLGNQLVVSVINSYPHGIPSNSRASWDFAWGLIIVGWLFGISGFILLIYGAISPDPPVHYSNNL